VDHTLIAIAAALPSAQMLETLKMSLNPIGVQAVQQSSVCCWTALPLHCVEHSEPQGQQLPYRSSCVRLAPHCVCDEGGRAIAQYVSASSLAELHLHSVGVRPHPPTHTPHHPPTLRGHQPLPQ
jgi:hypothetical protein